MKPADFDPEQFGRGRKHAIDLDLGPAANGVSLPVLLARGVRPGKTLVVTAGVHGDEYEGVRAILDLFRGLDPGQMSGDFLSVPVANPPAFWNGTRTSPLDGGNLARAFPGDLEAGPTSAIAYQLAHSIIARADLYVDLHSAGVKLLMPSLVGYDATDERSQDAARAFGASILWAHPLLAEGRTVSFAATRHIPWLYTEARGAGRIDPQDLQLFTQGVLNLMRHLQILPGEPVRAPIERHLYGSGDVDKGLTSTRRGFFVSSVALLQEVRAGEELGRLYDLHGEVIEVFRTPAGGVVVMVRQFPPVEPGEPLFLITEILS